MPDATIVVLPSPPGDRTRAAFLRSHPDAVDIGSVLGDSAPDTLTAARVCADIVAAAPRSPVALVAIGAISARLPDIARAQRAAHRLVVGYLIVDGPAPATSDAWPDAPVWIVGADDHARLRGWTALARGQLAGWLPSG